MKSLALASFTALSLLLVPTADARPPAKTTSGTKRPPIKKATPTATPSKAIPKTLGKGPMVKLGKVPKDNHAFWLGARGYVDTDIELDDFLHGDFTISAWVQPEFQYGGPGPIFGEKGAGTFLVGQGDYRAGPYDRDKQIPESPMLRIDFGSRTAHFEWPEAEDNSWSHITVVRSGNRIRMYVNGVERSVYRKKPTVPSKLEVLPTDGQTPHGTLRIGRRDNAETGQFYGFVDDVGVFKTALTPSQVASLASVKRLSGKESKLWRGIGFDKAKLDSLPSSLQTKLTPTGRAKQYWVSKTRRKSDRAVWGNPMHLMAQYPVPVQLPFKKNEVWKVTQGMNDPGPSHNGGTAYTSIDFSSVDGCTGTKVYANVPGRVVYYRSDHAPPSGEREGNFVHLRHNSKLGYTMMHFETNGLASKIDGGTPHPTRDHWKVLSPGVLVNSGEYIGTIGTDACHLHISSWETSFGDRIPYPFADFEVSTDQGATWTPVIRGIPRGGMWVRRTKDVPPPSLLEDTLGDWDPGIKDNPSSPEYLCNVDADCPSGLMCALGVSPLPGTKRIAPGQTTTSASGAPVMTKARTKSARRRTMSKATAKKVGKKVVYGGVCRLPPPS